jgi:flagellar protein FliS
VKTASQGRLIIMLYDEAVKQLDKALELMEADAAKKDPGRIETINKAVLKTQDIVTELEVSLDFDQGGEIAKNLFALYTWFNQELLSANFNQDHKRLLGVRNMLNDLRDAWSKVAATAAAERAVEPGPGLNIAG